MVSNSFSSAPGSLMLFGEYSVLQGGLALVTAIPAVMTVKLTCRTDHRFVLHSVLGSHECEIETLTPIAPFEYVITALQHFPDALTHGLSVEIVAEFESHLGLGSSAAVTVATLKAAYHLMNTPYDASSLLQKAIHVIQSVQGGGSGADAAASIYGGVIQYRIGHPVQYLRHAVPLWVVYSGYKTATRTTIARMRDRAQQETQLGALCEKLDIIAAHAAKAILAGDWHTCGEFAKLAHTHLQALGVSDHTLDALVTYLEQHGALGAKISGSGLGDCVIGFAEGKRPDAPLPEGTSWVDIQIHTESSGGLVWPTPLLQRGAFVWQTDQPISVFAPSNVALCKYWGKRDSQRNLPTNSSLSISLGHLGSHATVSLANTQDVFTLNGTPIPAHSRHAQRIARFLDYVRPQGTYFTIDLTLNIPVAAGLASSACIFASITMALNAGFQWNLSSIHLSQLARLGSGSASRSLESGFVLWHRGICEAGSDSFAEPIPVTWPTLRVGILLLHTAEKKISSRAGMQQTVETSDLYALWPARAERDVMALQEAIASHDFHALGKIAENNALTMHATMLNAWPPICYMEPETIQAMKTIWQAREAGLALYFTEDAGPNLKLLFEEKDTAAVTQLFPNLCITEPFNTVVLVDEQDRPIGVQEKLIAHQMGLRHRAISVFIFRNTAQGMEILLQQRHPAKYHSGGLWTNTCCSHPYPGEETAEAARRRLQEEMGLVTNLTYKGTFHYRATVGPNLVEDEIDHVFVGSVSPDVEPTPHPKEIAAIRWVTCNTLLAEIAEYPERFTAWLKAALCVATDCILS